MSKLLFWTGWKIAPEYFFLGSTALLGWLLIILDMPIYMLFEGRRFWPGPIRKLGLNSEEKRLKKIIQTQEKYIKSDRPKYLEATVEKRKFPMSETGQYEVRFPTRLGNTITAYETYPNSRYGMDAIFYWYRIWLKLDKDTREDIDNRSALVDSALYSSFALFVSGLAWFVYAIVHTLTSAKLMYVPRLAITWPIFLAFLVSGYLTYRLSVYLHSQFGEVFKSTFDVYGKELDVSDIVKEIATITNDPELLNRSRREQFKSAWRYLHNYRVKCPICGAILAPDEIADHTISKHGAPSNADSQSEEQLSHTSSIAAARVLLIEETANQDLIIEELTEILTRE
jgi:hypothetical protein